MCVTTSAVAGRVVLQHLLDEIDAPARRIELVAEQHIGRAGRLAEAAMHAGAQDLVGGCDVGIGELRQGEIGLHHTPAHMRPGLSTPLGSKLSFTRLLTPPSAPVCGSNTSTDARVAAEARMSVAWPPVAPRRGGWWRRRHWRMAAARPRSDRRPSRRKTAHPAAASRKIRRRARAWSRSATAANRRPSRCARTARHRGRCARTSANSARRSVPAPRTAAANSSARPCGA